MSLKHCPRRLVLCVFVLFAVAAAGERQTLTQSSAKIDFARDVQPILTTHCLGCHGATQQSGGYRLDRRSTALNGALRPVIIAGSVESSRLYRRITGSEFGQQMPPTGALAPREIETLSRWIEQGAEWPDALANEAEPPPPDAAVIALNDAIRAGNRERVRALVAGDRRSVNGRGLNGTTPLMWTVVYGDASLLRQLLDAGADPNIRNDAGATALMWAADDVLKTRLLLDGGAEPDARSGHGRTPLLLAAGQLGSEAVVQLLIERGAAATPAALIAAASRGNRAVIKLLLAAGARDTTGEAASSALRVSCFDCVDALASMQPLPPLRSALLNLFPPASGTPDAVRAALRLGADVNARDAQSRTVLMKAALADHMPAEIVQHLVERGADVSVRTPDGQTALDFARRVGNKAIIETLERVGASAAPDPVRPDGFLRNNSRLAAVQRSLPPLQRSAVEFYRKSGCVSCHHNSLTAMTVAAARARKIPVDEDLARKELDRLVEDAAAGHDAFMQGLVRFGGGPATVGYVLMGLSAAGHRRDLATDAMVRLLRLSQLPDGRWLGANRPPLEASEFTYTAVNMRALQLYGAGWCAACTDAIQRASAWLSRSTPVTTEDRTFRVFGLAWAKANEKVLRAAMADLVATQRSDGGWAQLPTLESDAYATGEVLVALHQAGLSSKTAAYTRGVQFLLRTQLADGSWFVVKRAHPTQPYFESGFPHGVNQYISAAATNWATIALIAAD